MGSTPHSAGQRVAALLDMRDAKLMPNQSSANARPALTTDADEVRVVIDWFKAEAQTIDCNADDIERWHLKKIWAALSTVDVPAQPKRYL